MGISSFERIPNIALHIIQKHLHHSSLNSLRQTSKTFNYLLEPFFFRSVKLVEQRNFWVEDDGGTELTEQLVQRILDPTDNIRTYIRDITILEWPDDGATLELVLESVTNLKTFSWESYSFIPKGVLATFSRRWPGARLNVSNMTRSQNLARQSYDLPDIDLLSNPQLYSLKYRVLGGPRNGNMASEFNLLKHIIVKADNLRILHLHFKKDSSFNLEALEQALTSRGLEYHLGGPYNLPFRRGDTFPPLEELKIDSWHYELSKSHCIAWKECMDWTKLKTLDLGEELAGGFLTTFRGSIPYLTSLQFPLHVGSDRELRCSVAEAGEFLASVTRLEKLHIECGGSFRQLWPYVSTLLPTIRVLDIKTSQLSGDTWTQSVLSQLQTQSSNLESLFIDFNMEQAVKAMGKPGARVPRGYIRRTISYWTWPEELFSNLARFSQLSSLHLRVTLSGLQSVHDSDALDGATQFFERFFKQNPKSKLSSLEMKIRKLQASTQAKSAETNELRIIWVTVEKRGFGGDGNNIELEAKLRTSIEPY